MNSDEDVSEWREIWKLSIPGHAGLWETHNAARREIREKWNRSLPFADGMFDRWERAAFLGFGKNSSVYDSVLVLGDVKVGENVWIGPNVILDGSGGLEIGNNCDISSGALIYSHDSVKRCLTGGRNPLELSPTKIGECTYIGSLSVISKGVSIGSHCVVGVHSFVKENIPDYSIAVGCPARIVGRVIICQDGSSVAFEYA